MVKTRIGLGCLAKDGFGSVELPENIELCCPQCGSLVADKGQCSVFFSEVPEEMDNHMTPNVVGLVVDCRAC